MKRILISIIILCSVLSCGRSNVGSCDETSSSFQDNSSPVIAEAPVDASAAAMSEMSAARTVEVSTDSESASSEDIDANLASPVSTGKRPEEDASGFVLLTDVIPDAILEIRYYSTYNFIGDRIPGYEQPIAMLTRQAADSLKVVSDELIAEGYRLKIFDGYRPQCAVDYFVKWAKDLDDTRMKEYFYPELSKTVLFPQGYIASRSGHTRGSTVDLTLFDMKLEKEVDMGCTYDYFGVASHPDVLPGQPVGAYKPINDAQYRNRMILRKAMLAHGFRPYEGEWWHFTLRNEPYPDTYFTFPLNVSSLH